MDVLKEAVSQSVPLPLWAYLAVVLVVGGAGFWWGRSERSHLRQMRQIAERVARYATGRVSVEAAEDAAPERGLEPVPEWSATLEAAKDFERVTLQAITADAYDVEPEPGNEPPREDGWRLGPAEGGDQDQDGDPPSVVPRYDWSQAKPVNPSHGVAPGWSHWAWYRRRATRFAERPRVLWGRLRRSTAGRVGDARLTHWVADLRASRSYTAAHSTRATRSWPWSTVAETVSQRWDDERAAARQRLRYVAAERTGATWSRQLGLMRDALQPTKRSIPPSQPYLGCTP